VEGNPFTPFSDDASGTELSRLVRAAMNESQEVENGEYRKPYNPGSIAPSEAWIYYRWTPTNSSLLGRYLVVVAVSDESVQAQTLNWVWGGALGIIVFSGAIAFCHKTAKPNKADGGREEMMLNTQHPWAGENRLVLTLR
jgi:hypothetical protein